MYFRNFSNFLQDSSGDITLKKHNLVPSHTFELNIRPMDTLQSKLLKKKYVSKEWVNCVRIGHDTLYLVLRPAIL
jgi:hypothetical protein